MRTTQIFLASSLYGAATLAAALDSGCFAPADRRLLLVANNATTPETSPALDEMPGFERLRGRFDGVLSWNEAISPSTRAAGPRGRTTRRCGNAICGCCGTSATTGSSWPSSPSRSTRRSRSRSSSRTRRSMSTPTA